MFAKHFPDVNVVPEAFFVQSIGVLAEVERKKFCLRRQIARCRVEFRALANGVTW